MRSGIVRGLVLGGRCTPGVAGVEERHSLVEERLS